MEEPPEEPSEEESPTPQFIAELETFITRFADKAAALGKEEHPEVSRLADEQATAMKTAAGNVTKELRTQYDGANAGRQAMMNNTVRQTGALDLLDNVIDFIKDIVSKLGLEKINDLLHCLKEFVRCIFNPSGPLECILTFIDCVAESLIGILRG